MTRTLLFISPDYASHYLPMAAIGEVALSRGHRVVFATGDALARKVVDDGFEHTILKLGPGSNGGVLDFGRQTSTERRQMTEFFTATRDGMVSALMHQASNRSNDLLFQPGRVADDLDRSVSRINPDAIVCDHLAFGATAALRGLRRPYIGFHPGHPSAIPTTHPYGYPTRIPIRIRAERRELQALEDLCQRAAASFTARYNEAVTDLDADADTVSDAFAAVSAQGTLVNYPAALGMSYGLPVSVRFIGSSVRRSPLTPALAERFAEPRSRPRIYVSLGTFFSARTDLLRKIATAFRHEPVELVISRGATPTRELGHIPAHWTVERQLPQPAVIARCSLVITHGGNNTITEALTAGVPILAGPLSTDQFAGSADVERAGLGRAFDPNHDDSTTIADLAYEVMTTFAAPAAAMGQALRARPGQVVAADFVEESMLTAQTG